MGPSRTRLGRGLLLGAALLAPVCGVSAQEAHPELAPMERLIGGQWHLGTDSYHTFTWGVGKRSVVVSSYFVTPEGEKLVSEGTFFYHPGHDAVRGHAVAVDMGIDLFEYAVHFQGDTIVLDLRAFGPAAPSGPMRETWTFTDDDHYEWALLQEGAEGWERIMGGTYERRPAGP